MFDPLFEGAPGEHSVCEWHRLPFVIALEYGQMFNVQ